MATPSGDATTQATLPAYLVVGDDPHLSGEAVDRVLKGVSRASIDEFGPADELEAILQALATPSMFDDRRAVVLREADRLPAESQRRLIAYLQEPVPDSTLVLVAAKASAQLVAAVRGAGHVIQVGKGRRNDLLLWLRKELSGRGLQAGGDAMNALIDAVGEQRLALARAVEELALAIGVPGRVRVDDVQRQFQGRADVKLFGFIDAVAMRQRGAALQALRLLLAQGEPPQLVFWNLARHFRMLLMATEGGPTQLAQSLAIPQWRAEKLLRQVRNFRLRELLDAYEVLAQTDLKIKTSQEPEGLALERVVVEICGKQGD